MQKLLFVCITLSHLDQSTDHQDVLSRTQKSVQGKSVTVRSEKSTIREAQLCCMLMRVKLRVAASDVIKLNVHSFTVSYLGSFVLMIQRDASVQQITISTEFM